MLESLSTLISAVGMFIAGLTGQVDISNSTAQVANSVSSTTAPVITSVVLDKVQVGKPDTVTVAWTGQNIPDKTPIGVSVTKANGSVILKPVNVAFSLKNKKLTIPNTFIDGSYNVVLSATFNKQLITLASTPFSVVSQPIANAELNVTYPIEGYTFMNSGNDRIAISWNSKNIPAATPVVFSLVNKETNQEVTLTAPATKVSALKRSIQFYDTYKGAGKASAGTYQVKVTANPVGKASVVGLSKDIVLVDYIGVGRPFINVKLDSSTSTLYTGDTVSVSWNPKTTGFNPDDLVEFNFMPLPGTPYTKGSAAIKLGRVKVSAGVSSFKVPAGFLSGDHTLVVAVKKTEETSFQGGGQIETTGYGFANRAFKIIKK